MAQVLLVGVHERGRNLRTPLGVALETRFSIKTKLSRRKRRRSRALRASESTRGPRDLVLFLGESFTLIAYYFYPRVAPEDHQFCPLVCMYVYTPKSEPTCAGFLAAIVVEIVSDSALYLTAILYIFFFFFPRSIFFRFFCCGWVFGLCPRSIIIITESRVVLLSAHQHEVFCSFHTRAARTSRRRSFLRVRLLSVSEHHNMFMFLVASHAVPHHRGRTRM